MNTSDEEHNDISKDEEQTELGEGTRSATTIGNEVGLFIRQIDSLAETLPLTMVVIQAAHGAAYEKYEKFVQEHCETESNGDGQTVLIPVDFMGRYKRLDGQIHKALLAHKAVPRSFLVSLVSHYDAFLGI